MISPHEPCCRSAGGHACSRVVPRAARKHAPNAMPPLLSGGLTGNVVAHGQVHILQGRRKPGQEEAGKHEMELSCHVYSLLPGILLP